MSAEDNRRAQLIVAAARSRQMSGGEALDVAHRMFAEVRAESAPTLDAWKDRDDKPLPEDEAIDAAFPTNSGRHDTYMEATRMVGARYSKGGLVALVNWLLLRAEAKR